jgi:hypothetical protein
VAVVPIDGIVQKIISALLLRTMPMPSAAELLERQRLATESSPAHVQHRMGSVFASLNVKKMANVLVLKNAAAIVLAYVQRQFNACKRETK